ncbi:PREDICTED: dapper homolog 1 isoform X1 [Nanorana parkeri]|uniref:dapper homolog 1 isoform X1 n=1 Tax=Nanorana parkeri TaxID=125878 RepID=UPI000854F461|nr:PREDICTED: dapper homolog 1 isoform X1 [Nanorana parkeri]
MKPLIAASELTQESSPRRKDKAEDSERHRTRERLEATLAGLGELGYLRHRQEILVKAALSPGVAPCTDPAGKGDNPRSLEERFLEENILLLKKQLNCLRKRDAGLLSQLHELDKQINDLKLDVEKTAEEHLETDSRPSSGFYELSDGTSGSLSNSSNSVFSECLSSCQSSTCFCSPLEASLNLTDGQPRSSDDFFEWLDYREGQCENTGTVRRSFSVPHSNTTEVVADVHPKYQCDLVSKNGNDVYRYPSPLHAVAVQSPIFLLSMMGNMKVEEEGEIGTSMNDCSVSELDTLKSEDSLLPHSSPCSVPFSSSKKLDGYILSVIQKKSHPVRTNKPRTSANVDPAKGILRHGSICVKQTGGIAHNGITNLKNSKQPCLHSSGIPSMDNGTYPALKQCLKETQNEQLESKVPLASSYQPSNINELQSQNNSRNVKSVPQNLGRGSGVGTPNIQKELHVNPNTVASHFSNVTSPLCNGSPKETHKITTLPQEVKIVQQPKRISPKNTIDSYHASSHDERPSLDFKSEGSSSQSLDEGLLVNAHYIPAQQQGVKLHKSIKNVKIVKSSTLKHRSNVQHVVENGSQTLKEKSKVVTKKCRFPDDLDINKKVRKISPRSKKVVESGIVGKNAGASKSASKPHGHAKDVVLAKPRHKRGDYRRWKSSAEISYEEALRRARRRHQREMVGLYAQVPVPYASPYAYIASDSEYSAECESLFHSTVVDTSEDEQSNYTTNCFGDSESSLSEVEFVGESTTSSDTDESGGLIWSQFVHTLPMQTPTASALQTTAKAFVKIKASHNLKKKILRFRSGSLKLMTTV